jgi:restriction endonuclease Mrr
LISRIRHRQFGVLVTTSHVHRQTYEEVREDKHPIIFISGGDIAKLLISKGYKSSEQLKTDLTLQFPKY